MVDEHITKADAENAIWTNILYKRFYLAEEAPICKGRMCEDLGYNAVSPTAQAILDGIYKYPEDFDVATRELCKECALIRLIIPADSVDKNDKGRLHGTLEKSNRGNLGLIFPHYGRNLIALHLTLPCPKGNPSLSSWTGTKALGTRALGYATKSVWLLSYHKTTLHSTHGSRL